MTSLIMMIIDIIMLTCMGIVVRKVYKIDRFKNKFIFSLILSIILSLTCDFTNWVVLWIKNDYDLDDVAMQEYFHDWNTSMDVAAAFFMAVALKLNLRIWTVYYIKIVFMGQLNFKIDQITTKFQRLNKIIRVIDMVLISFIVV